MNFTTPFIKGSEIKLSFLNVEVRETGRFLLTITEREGPSLNVEGQCACVSAHY